MNDALNLPLLEFLNYTSMIVKDDKEASQRLENIARSKAAHPMIIQLLTEVVRKL